MECIELYFPRPNMAQSLYSCMTRKLLLRRLYKGRFEVNQGIRSLQTLTIVFVLVGRLCSSDHLRILLDLIFHGTLSLQSVGIDELIPRHRGHHINDGPRSWLRFLL